jgi:hypothetical protein
MAFYFQADQDAPIRQLAAAGHAKYLRLSGILGLKTHSIRFAQSRGEPRAASFQIR